MLICKQMSEKLEEPKRSWFDLPPEILCIVSSHLFVRDFTTFRAICKSWQSSTSLIRKVPLLIDSPHFLCSCLLSLDYNKCTFLHPTYHGVDHVDIPILYKAHIYFSKYGWLLLTQEHDFSIFFFNLFTNKRIELPKYKMGYKFTAMCFSSPPTSLDCFVLGIIDKKKFGFIRRGDKDWTHCDWNGRKLSTVNLVLYQGLCYCLDNEGNLGVFDPTANPSTLTIYASKSPLPNGLRASSSLYYLVESDEGKLYVVIKENEIEIYVFEVKVSNLPMRKGGKLCKVTWDRVRSLGNRMMYLSTGGSFTEVAVAKWMSNKIYFPMFRSNINVFYSFSTSRFQSFIEDHSSKKSHNIGHSLKACWMRGVPNGVSSLMLEW